jgi:hypothetical protein
MKRSIVLSLLSLFLFPAVLRADVIEVKGEGILNGKVLSRNEKEVKFRDSKGKQHLYPAQDVLYMDADLSSEKPLSEKVKQKAAELLKVVKKAPESIKKTTDDLTEKFIGVAGKPLDRSVANNKSAQLAKAMDDANGASAASISKVSTFNKEVLRQQNEAKDSASQHTESKGRFTSL